MNKVGEGVRDVRNAVCVSDSDVLAGVIQGLLGSSARSQGVKECKFSGVWSGIDLTELQQPILSFGQHVNWFW